MYCVTQRLVLTVNKAPEDCFLLSNGFFFVYVCKVTNFFLILHKDLVLIFITTRKNG